MYERGFKIINHWESNNFSTVSINESGFVNIIADVPIVFFYLCPPSLVFRPWFLSDEALGPSVHLKHIFYWTVLYKGISTKAHKYNFIF